MTLDRQQSSIDVIRGLEDNSYMETGNK